MIDSSQKQEYIRIIIKEASKQQLDSLDFKEKLFYNYKYEPVKFVKEKSFPKISEEAFENKNAPINITARPDKSVQIFEMYYAISGASDDEIVKLSQSPNLIQQKMTYKREHNYSYIVFRRNCGTAIKNNNNLIDTLKAEALNISHLIETVIAEYNTEVQTVNADLKIFIEEESDNERKIRKNNEDVLNKLNPFN